MICSCKVQCLVNKILFFCQTAPSLTPLPYIFWCQNLRGWGSFSFSTATLWSMEGCRVHLPAQAFKTLRGCPVPSWPVQALCEGFIGFPCNQRNTACSHALSLSPSLFPSPSPPLFSTLSFPQGRPTPGQRPFAVRPPSTHHEFSPDSVAQVSLDGTLGHHRLSSFLGSRGTLWPKGPLGRYLGDAPPSLRVFLSFCLVKRWGDDLFSRLDSH